MKRANILGSRILVSITVLLGVLSLSALAQCHRSLLAASYPWFVQTVDNSGSVGMDTSLALDPSGRPGIAYRDYGNADLKFARWDGEGWIIQTVDSSGEVGEGPSLAFDNFGNPAISYCDRTGQALKFAHWNGTGWDIQQVDSSDYVFQDTSLDFDPSGNPAIGYIPLVSGLKFARWDGSKWNIQVVDGSSHPWACSLAFDPSGKPALSYTNTVELRFASWTGTTWNIQTVGGDFCVGQSLAFDTLGRPAISYSTGHDLKFAQWDGVVWSIQTIETVESSEQVGRYNSLAFDSYGNAAISYEHVYPTGPIWEDCNLKLARWNGVGWDIEIVDYSGVVGEYNSLAFGPSGNPAISYHDWSHGSLKFAQADTTAPSTPVIMVDGETTASTTQLHATWTSSDPESGIAEYQYAIGTSAGAADVVDWTSAGTSTAVTKTGLSLTWGSTYYFAVKSKNGSGLWSEVGVSNGITVSDATPPTTPVVTDDGASTSNTTQLHATWTSSDPESGIAEYRYAIGTNAGGTDVVGWTSTGTTVGVTRTGLNLAPGTTYYIAVKAKNGAGMWSDAGESDGIAVPRGASGLPIWVWIIIGVAAALAVGLGAYLVGRMRPAMR